MNQKSKLPDAPAPQLTNLPVSEDDPFHLDPERELPITPSSVDEPDSTMCPPMPKQVSGTKSKTKTDPDEEP